MSRNSTYFTIHLNLGGLRDPGPRLTKKLHSTTFRPTDSNVCLHFVFRLCLLTRDRTILICQSSDNKNFETTNNDFIEQSSFPLLRIMNKKIFHSNLHELLYNTCLKYEIVKIPKPFINGEILCFDQTKGKTQPRATVWHTDAVSLGQQEETTVPPYPLLLWGAVILQLTIDTAIWIKLRFVWKCNKHIFYSTNRLLIYEIWCV